MSNNSEDTHPIAPGFYIIDIEQAHVIGFPGNDLVGVTNEPGYSPDKIFYVSLWGTGYKIQHFATKRYAGVPEEVKGSIVHLVDSPTLWNIQKDGESALRIVVPNKDLYWTESVVWGARLFKLYGSNGEKDQVFTFKPFDRK